MVAVWTEFSVLATTRGATSVRWYDLDGTWLAEDDVGEPIVGLGGLTGDRHERFVLATGVEGTPGTLRYRTFWSDADPSLAVPRVGSVAAAGDSVVLDWGGGFDLVSAEWLTYQDPTSP